MEKTLSVGITVCILLLPTLASAAGFAKQSLFLSQSTVAEGQTVFIYAVVTDEKPTSFTGKLVFSEKDTPIGSVAVYLESGKASTVSVSWKPTAGEHIVTAQLEDTEGTVTETEDATFFVEQSGTIAINAAPAQPKPEPVQKKPDAIDSSQPIVDMIGRITPSLAAKAAPTFTYIDQSRQNGATLLNEKSEWSKKQISKAATAKSSTINTIWMMFSTFVLYFCAALLYAVSNIGIFYPAIVFVFFFLLWRIYAFISN